MSDGFDEGHDHHVFLETGERLAYRVDHACAVSADAPVVVLAPGFGRRMYHYATLARYFTSNGFHAIRYDPVNHVGQSDGDSRRFTMSSGLASMSAVIGAARRHFPQTHIGIFASSLTSRIAFQLLPSARAVSFLITASPVVNLQETLTRVFGVDYTQIALEDLPPTESFEGNSLDPATFYRDVLACGWHTLDGTMQALSYAWQPIVSFIGTDDEWVAIDDLNRVMATAVHEERLIIELVKSGHEIGRNAAIARAFAAELVRRCMGLTNRAGEFVEPPYGDLLGRALRERRAQRVVVPAADVARRN